MESETSSPYSQEPGNCPYPEPYQYSPRPHHTSCRSVLILLSRLCLVLSIRPFTSSFLTKTLYAPLLSPKSATRPACLSA